MEYVVKYNCSFLSERLKVEEKGKGWVQRSLLKARNGSPQVFPHRSHILRVPSTPNAANRYQEPRTAPLVASAAGNPGW